MSEEPVIYPEVRKVAENVARILGVANAQGRARIRLIPDFPQQDNVVDCGAFVILAMQAVMRSEWRVEMIDWN